MGKRPRFRFGIGFRRLSSLVFASWVCAFSVFVNMGTCNLVGNAPKCVSVEEQKHRVSIVDKRAGASSRWSKSVESVLSLRRFDSSLRSQDPRWENRERTRTLHGSRKAFCVEGVWAIHQPPTQSLSSTFSHRIDSFAKDSYNTYTQHSFVITLLPTTSLRVPCSLNFGVLFCD